MGDYKSRRRSKGWGYSSDLMFTWYDQGPGLILAPQKPTEREL